VRNIYRHADGLVLVGSFSFHPFGPTRSIVLEFFCK